MKSKASRTKKLHVLFTGLVSPKVITGGDQLFIDIAPRLPKDMKIVIVTPEFAKSHWDTVDQTSIEFRLLPKNPFDNNYNPLFIFLSYVIRSVQTYKILKKDNVETIYSCSDIAYADIWPAYWLRKKQPNVKWISRIYHVLLSPKDRQGSYITNLIAFKLQRLSFWMMKRRGTKVLALNDKLYHEVTDLGFTKKQLGVLGAGIDFDTISSFKPTKTYDYDVAVLARVAPVKGIFDAVKIWKKVHAAHPDAKLVWIGGGGGAPKSQMENQIKVAGLSKTFHLAGFVEKEEAYNMLKSAKLFLCTDHENGWGLAVCEAMASGLPVASYDLDIFGSVYKKGYKTAKLFDTDGFADNVIELLNSQKERKKLAKEAVEQAREFDHQQVITDLLTYL